MGRVKAFFLESQKTKLRISAIGVSSKGRAVRGGFSTGSVSLAWFVGFPGQGAPEKLRRAAASSS